MSERDERARQRGEQDRRGRCAKAPSRSSSRSTSGSAAPVLSQR
ncbi:MAG TPA: hypothetical protein VG148_19210 [Pyrinomonadaceae bacterium]|nr:hypothetical protein [Pyrinomonadaceae bacterium]